MTLWFTVHDIDQYTNDNRQLDQRLNDLQGQQANKEADKQRLSQQIQQYKGKRHQLDNDVESLNYQLVKATEAFEKYTGQLNVLEERKKNQSETNARYEEEQENLIELLENISNEISEAQDTYKSLKSKQKNSMLSFVNLKNNYMFQTKHTMKNWKKLK